MSIKCWHNMAFPMYSPNVSLPQSMPGALKSPSRIINLSLVLPGSSEIERRNSSSFSWW